MSDDPTESLIDRIYEAGVIVEHWTDVLEDINRVAGGIGGAFLAPRSGRWVTTPGIEEMVSDLMTTGLIHTNERTRRLLALNPPGFARDNDIFNLDDLPNEPIYRDFFIARGGGFGAATLVEAPSGDTMIIHVERAYSHGLVEPEAVRQLNRLRPHLARASLISSRLSLRTASTAAETLELLGLAGAVLGRRGCIVATNHLLERLVPGILQDRRDRLTLANKRADSLLEATIESLARPGAGSRSVQSIPVAAEEGAPPLIIHVVPVKGVAHDVFSKAIAIVVVTPIVPKDVPTAQVVQGLFDLTPAEARIARKIGHGRTVGEIAATTNVSLGTVRAQVKAILAKTGLHRQADLIGLLRGASAVMLPER